MLIPYPKSERRVLRPPGGIYATMSRQPHEDLITLDTGHGIVAVRGNARCTFLGRKNEYKSSVDLECLSSFGSIESCKSLICFRFTLRYL